MAAVHVFVAAIRSVERPPTILQADAAHPGAPFDKCPQFADKV